mmetsp:Transcript_2933/g.8532  ORF Transcript_2933/g.8532 Transcript_2933/m.8532 type:complete len:514 (+) Transcript_2933:85-1626(+)|eukprot:CAMPEP_0181030940 /NCGR_PEP_ID=MMETSP1070-20121207/5979_1 /TAXON_ID=265543 /ORGANISM="Minutocellus polymorphus, Strain NH13" /LENGTH=513 /DNA_ID=CAMNT_0023108309 /DNA_START=85 /DNA_END=1626 /DNA_ORIENTATION=-
MVSDGGGRHKPCHLEPKRSMPASGSAGTATSSSHPDGDAAPITVLDGPMQGNASRPNKARRKIKRSGLFALSLLFFAAAVLLLSNEYLLEGAYEQMGDLTDEDLTRAALMSDQQQIDNMPMPPSDFGGGPEQLTTLHSPPTSAYHIFQSSIGMSGSTLLSNILIGLFEGPDATYSFLERDWKTHFAGSLDAPINSTVVTKTHVINVDDLVERYLGNEEEVGKFERIFVVSSTRGEAHIDDKYCDPANLQYSQFVLCLDYDEFTYKQPEEMAKSVSFVRQRLVEAFPYFANIPFDEQRTIARLEEMAQVMEQMKDEKFGTMDRKFGIHGHHKGRFAKKFGADTASDNAGKMSEGNPAGVVKQKLKLTRKGGKNNIIVGGGRRLAGSLRGNEDKSEQVRVLHILKKHKDVAKPRSWRNPTITDSREEAMVQIQNVLDKLREVKVAGDSEKLKKLFEETATVESDCASAKDGGDLNFFGRGRMHKPFENASFALGVGDMSDIVETKSGLHLILRVA